MQSRSSYRCAFAAPANPSQRTDLPRPCWLRLRCCRSMEGRLSPAIQRYEFGPAPAEDSRTMRQQCHGALPGLHGRAASDLIHQLLGKILSEAESVLGARAPRPVKEIASLAVDRESISSSCSRRRRRQEELVDEGAATGELSSTRPRKSVRTDRMILPLAPVRAARLSICSASRRRARSSSVRA